MTKLPIRIGTDLDTGAPFDLQAHKFNRHTFWCGQSGSGKTYALGVVLERLLLDTGLPLLILDPNSDFVHLGEPHAEAPAELAAQLSRCDVRVLRPRGEEGSALHASFVEMNLTARAAVLRLDPIEDADEFQVMRHLSEEYGPQEGPQMLAALAASTDPAQIRLSRRIQNLTVTEWDLWARGADAVEDVAEERPDAMVLDLGGFHYPEEPAAAALAVLDRLWATRERRDPVLIVIDEAHNLCPAQPLTPLAQALTERLIQIAAEGRKFGLWLLLSTQRPSKIHPQVLSQCDNLALLRTNSPADLEHIADYFGATPRALLDQVPQATQGQALFSGGFATEATRVQMADRISLEGGSDVAVPAVRRRTKGQ